MHSRRTVVRTIAALPFAAVLTACATATEGNVTTVTINTAEISADVGIVVAILNTILALSGLPAATVTAVSMASNLIQKDVANVAVQTGGSETYTFNKGTVPAFLTGLVSDLKTAAMNIVIADIVSPAATAKLQVAAADIGSVASLISGLWAATSASTFETTAQKRASIIGAIRQRHGLSKA